MKKILALALAVLMIMSLSVVAFAADTQSITVKHDHAGHTYEAYQIFSGDFDPTKGVLSNIVWGSGVTANAQNSFIDAAGDVMTAAAVAAQLENDTASTDSAAALEFAKIWATDGYLGTPSATTSTLTDTGVYILNGLNPGYYLVKDAEGSQSGVGEAETFYILVVPHGNAEVNPKAGVPSLTKKVDDINDSNGTEFKLIDSADHDIGDDVTFTLTAELPRNGMQYYEHYYIAFHDVLSQPLKLNVGSIKVELITNNKTAEAVDVTSSFVPTTPSAQEFQVACADILPLLPKTAEDKTDFSQIYDFKLTYTAKLTADGVIYGGEGNENVAWLEYSNNPNVDYNPDTDTPPTGETPKDKVKVFTYYLQINKTAGGSGAPLAGADFTLYKKDKATNAFKPVTFVLDDNGVAKVYTYNHTGANGLVYRVDMDTTGALICAKNYDDPANPVDLPEAEANALTTGADALKLATSFYFLGLDDGDYKLEETVTPAGYNSIAPVEFTIDATHDHAETATGIHLNSLTGTNGFAGQLSQGSVSHSVMNVKGSVLPATGGIGTTIFYVVGSVLVLAAVVLLVTKRRMSTSEM